jgi:hypothetical protein
MRISTFFFCLEKGICIPFAQLDGGTTGAAMFWRAMLPVKCAQFLKGK